MLDLSLLKFFTQYFFISQKSFFLLFKFSVTVFHLIVSDTDIYIYIPILKSGEKVGDYFNWDNYNWK